MTDLTTLHEGGSGLGRDIHDADTGKYCRHCLTNYSDAKVLREACLVKDLEFAAIHGKYQLALMFAALTFIAGFLLAWGLK